MTTKTARKPTDCDNRLNSLNHTCKLPYPSVRFKSTVQKYREYMIGQMKKIPGSFFNAFVHRNYEKGLSVENELQLPTHSSNRLRIS